MAGFSANKQSEENTLLKNIFGNITQDISQNITSNISFLCVPLSFKQFVDMFEISFKHSSANNKFRGRTKEEYYDAEATLKSIHHHQQARSIFVSSVTLGSPFQYCHSGKNPPKECHDNNNKTEDKTRKNLLFFCSQAQFSQCFPSTKFRNGVRVYCLMHLGEG